MIEKKNVLIFPSGAENAINIFNSLKYNIHFELFGASMIYDEEHFIFDKELNIKDENFFNKFNELIEKLKIDFILPTHDEISYFLVKNEANIKKAKVCCSSLQACEIAYDKSKIYETFKNEFFAPIIYEKNSNMEYPVFAKPKHGAGGKGTFKVESYSELENIDFDKLLIMEYLPGKEYTVDCFTNRNGELQFCYARTRERVTNGIAYHSIKVEDNTEFLKIAKILNNTLKFRGAWFFQVKEDKNGKLKLMEFSIRQAGTMIYFREYGINFPALTLFDFMDLDVIPIMNNVTMVLERCIHNSFKLDYNYENVYFDFDDTIIIDKKVNTTAIKFIYQAINSNKNVYLITKHSDNIYESLKNYHIDKELFKDIIHLQPDQSKKDVIKKDKSIFIDNYFKERYEVYNELNIPVFDVDAIECLIDDSKI